MIEKESCANIGACVKLHGVKGELVIRLNSGITIDSIDAGFMYFELDGGLVPFKIKTIRSKNDTDILVSFYDTENENTINRLIPTQVFVENNDLNIEDSADNDLNYFVGWKAKDTNSGELGIITVIIEITNNPLFVIDNNGSELLIPANDDLITDIDKENKIISLSLPKGLLDVN